MGYTDKPNCCTDLSEVVAWFRKLKEEGVEGEDVLCDLEFDSDEYPDLDVLKQAKVIVFGEEA